MSQLQLSGKLSANRTELQKYEKYQGKTIRILNVIIEHVSKEVLSHTVLHLVGEGIDNIVKKQHGGNCHAVSKIVKIIGTTLMLKSMVEFVEEITHIIQE